MKLGIISWLSRKVSWRSGCRGVHVKVRVGSELKACAAGPGRRSPPWMFRAWRRKPDVHPVHRPDRNRGSECRCHGLRRPHRRAPHSWIHRRWPRRGAAAPRAKLRAQKAIFLPSQETLGPRMSALLCSRRSPQQALAGPEARPAAFTDGEFGEKQVGAGSIGVEVARIAHAQRARNPDQAVSRSRLQCARRDRALLRACARPPARSRQAAR